MTGIIIFNWQHPTYYKGEGPLLRPLLPAHCRGSASATAPSMKAEIARAFAILTQFPKLAGAL